ncbi:MAG TPA: YihY/virulence factor BrkB family protein [Candidatus Heimdallarchaeota archaeon]|nr:YihY/virulence factor BrkB family protein [Candidatus Heimdallarchaeota archaeon]
MKKKYLGNIKAIFLKFREKDIFTLSAAVAFYAFLSVFPFLIMLLYASSFFLKEAVTVEKIKIYFRLFPPSVIDTVIANLENILESGQILSLISFLFLIYFAFKVFRQLEQALNKIFSIDRKIESWKTMLKAFSFFLLTALVLLVSFFTGNAFLILATKVGKIPLINSYVVILLGHVAVETFFFALSYKLISRRKLSFKSVMVGGFAATMLWEILKHIFGVYIVRIKLYSIIYGSIGSLILLILWLYYSILVYLIGAEIAMELE